MNLLSQQNQNEGIEALTFEKWLEMQDDQVRALVNGNIKSLKSALKSERENREMFEKDVRELAKEVEVTTEMQKRVTKLTNQLTASDRRIAFYEAAHAANATNLKLAFIVATQENLFDKQGNVNFELLQRDHPELFTQKKMPRDIDSRQSFERALHQRSGHKLANDTGEATGEDAS